MSNGIRYILYARKSSEAEDRQVQSIPDQKAALLRLAESKGLQVVDILEESHSAKNPHSRPVFASLLQRIEKGEADGILSWSPNRLFRNPKDAGDVQWLLQQGVIQSIQTIDREYLPGDNSLLLAVEAAHANEQIRDLSKNVKRGLNEKARRGWWPTMAKPGYRCVPQFSEGKAIHTVGPDSNRFPLVRRAWDMMLTGAYSVPQILDQLNGWGYLSPKTRQGGGMRPMGRSSLYRLFQDPFYAGRFLFGGEWHRVAHESMVTESEFARVQQLLGKDNHIQPQKQVFAFTGMIRCGVCGCLVTAERKVKHYPTTGNTAEYVYYHCTGSKGCRIQSVKEEYIAEEILGLLKSFEVNNAAVELAEAAIENARVSAQTVDESIGKQRQTGLHQAKRRLDALFAMRENGEITSAEFMERKQQYQQGIHSLQNETANEAARLESNAKAVTGAVRYLNAAPKRFSEAQVNEQREIASLFAESYVLTLGKLEITVDPLLQKIGTFEPPKPPSDMVGSGTNAPARPIQRKGRDSNPGTPYEVNTLAVCSIRPLWHPSVLVRVRRPLPATKFYQ